MFLELPANVVEAFGLTDEALAVSCWLLSGEVDIEGRFGKRPGDLTVAELREVFGVVVH